MSHDHPLDEEQIATLLALLPPAPQGWVRAAQELPLARLQVDGLVERATADAAFREAILADLERALLAAGVAADEHTVSYVRRRLA
jgi:hypothetical protein